MTTARDIHNQIEYAKETGREEGRAEGLEEGLAKGLEEGREEGREEGLAKGRAEGLEKGREERNLEVAINFLKLGTPCEIVAKATGLSVEEVTKLKEKEQEPATL